MNHAIRFKKLVSDAASILLQFAHGGLLVTGIVVAAFIASRVGLSGVHGTQSELRGLFSGFSASSHAPGNGVGNFLPASLTGDGEAAPVPVNLTPEMRRVVDYLSHKYRVAAPALEPMVAAAQMVGGRLGLDPLLIVAVMAVESRFNPFAQSDQGAQGLMQVIPKYHLDKLADADYDHPLLDPVTNIEVGAKVLKESIQRAGGMTAGLQQYAGASGDESGQYAKTVMAERQRLEQAKKSRPVGA